MRQVSLSTLVRQQVARFMEGTDLPAVQVTTMWGTGSVEWMRFLREE